MNNFIKQVIEEKFASKAQQRYFYAQASKGGKKGKKWAKLADEFSSETNFKKIPDKVEKKEEVNIDVEKDVDEIVDNKGNISRSNISVGAKKVTTTSKERTDKVVNTAHGTMGIPGGGYGPQTQLRQWGTLWEDTKNIKEIEMDSALGYEDTLGADASYDEALNHFTKKLGIPEDEAKERLEAMGYIPDQKDLVRLVENPKTFIKDYIESVLVNKSKNSEIIDNETDDAEINPLVLKQLQSLKKTLSKNNIPLEKIINHLKSE
jgi:hypothetical protein